MRGLDNPAVRNFAHFFTIFCRQGGQKVKDDGIQKRMAPVWQDFRQGNKDKGPVL